MSRLPAITEETLPPESVELYREIVRTREAALAGPFGIWVRHPTVGAAADKMQNAFRLHGTFSRRVAELLILIVARAHSAQYAWYLHKGLALKAGLPESTIEAIYERRVPNFHDPVERAVYEVASELLLERNLSQPTYSRALEDLGENRLIEAVSAVGFYGMVCLTLNSFRVPAPEDQGL